MKPTTFVIGAVCLLALPLIASAQTGAIPADRTDRHYPTKPIRLLVPFATGGGADITCRPFVQRLSERINQSIVYENRGGAGGVLAGETVARAAPDGYTLLLGAVSVMTVTVNMMKIPFDPVKDFVPITRIVDVASLLAVRPTLSQRTFKEIVAFARANPGKIIWGFSGIGSPAHLWMERFRMEQGIDVTQVFYKGAGPGTLALISGEVDIMSANLGVFMTHIKAGRLRPIATSSAQRLPSLPDLPTYAESGFSGYDQASWYGLVAPARTPDAIIRYLYSESVKVLKEPDIVAGLTRDGATAVGNTPQAFAQFIRDEIAASAKVIKAANIKVQQ
jgi:tripartite-type tricarboxylate transporter receptor subunit TctC